MRLASGTHLGPYRIVSPLGAGGMGEVYRALDTRLDRTVAIKILPAELSNDPERRSRFEREAKTIAALTHPNICTLYDVGHHEGVEFLVMELLDGKTLAARLESGPMALAEAIACAIQIADALDKSHREGIIHRDLKPSNVMLTRPRTGSESAPHVKLLDFGLAKRSEGESVVEGVTVAATITAQGQILGTLHYMAPEQLQGKPADARSDVFAFGALVYEMVTGRRPFEGSTPASLIGAILHTSAPPMTRSTDSVPPPLDRMVAVCLAKDPEERWSSVHDVLIQLRGIAASGDVAPMSVAAGKTRRERLAWAVASVAGVAAIVLTTMLLTRTATRPTSEAALDLLTVLPPSQTSLAYGEAAQISPDGRLVAFVAVDTSGRGALYVRNRDSLTIRRLPDTEGASMPFWSPDNRSLGFFAGGHLKAIALAGGLPRLLDRAPVPRGGAWNRNDLILYSAIPNAPPMLIPAAGGQAKPAPVEKPERGFRCFPWFLPDGRHYLYLGLDEQSGIGMDVRVASIDSTDTRRLLASKANGVFASGFLLYRREAALVAQPFDPDTLALSGTPAVIVENVAYDPIAFRALFSVSDTGALVYQPTSGGKELVWFDRQGARVGAATPPGEYNRVCFTGDERQIVYEQADPLSGNVDLWSLDLATKRTTRLTFDPAVDFFPVCSPTTPPEVMFASLRAGPPHLYRQMITAPGSEKEVMRARMAPILASDWSRDGQTILYSQLSPTTNWDIWVWTLSAGEPRPVLATPGEERNGKLSTDGRWMAYVSGETGRVEVYVQPFPLTGVKWQISRGGGDQPEWRRDGSELYYIAPDRKLIAVDVKGDTSGFAPGEARALAQTRLTDWGQGPILGNLYAATADGKRFLVSNQTDAVNPITIMLNWTAARAQ